MNPLLPRIAHGWILATGLATVAALPLLAAPDSRTSSPPPLPIPGRPVAASPAFQLPPLEQDPTGCWQLGWQHLASYDYGMAELQAAAKEYSDTGAPLAASTALRLPAPVRKLSGRKVRLSGYVLPLNFKNGLVTEMFLVSSPPSCCYGAMLQPNEMVFVRLQGQGIMPSQYTPYEVIGTLQVGEFFTEKQFLGLYQIDGGTVSPPQ